MANKYNLIATIEEPNGFEIRTVEADCYFITDDDDYGNGTYLNIGDTYYDIRYDTTYSPERQVSYLAHWADNQWTGEKGAYKLIGLQIQNIVEEGGE